MATPPPPPPAAAPQKIDRRKMICGEIISTEESYASSLKSVCEVWLDALDYSVKTEEQPVLPPADIQLVFNNIRLFSEFHQRFLADLKLCAGQKVENNFGSTAGPSSAANRRISVARGQIQEDCWGAVFLTFAPFLKMYTQYLNNHENAVKYIQNSIKDGKNKKWLTFMEKANVDPRAKGNQLQSFLIMPVQRVPRYKLLLAELLKNTPKEHADYLDLEKSFEQIDSVAHSINTGMKEQQHQFEILALQEQFTHPISLIKPGRTLINTGHGIKRGQHRDNDYFFILFNDLFVYCSGSPGKYKSHLEIPITPQFSVLENTKTDGHVEYILDIQNDIKSFQMILASRQEQQEWLKHFTNVKKAMSEKLQSRRSYSEKSGNVKAFLPIFDLRYTRRHPRNAINIGILHHQGSLLHNVYFFIIITFLYIFTSWTLTNGFPSLPPS